MNHEQSDRDDLKSKADSGARLLMGGIVTWQVSKQVVQRLYRWLLRSAARPQEQRSGSAGMAPASTSDFSRALRILEPKPVVPETGKNKQGRAADRDLDIEHGANLKRRERLGTLLVEFAFLVALAGGVGFLVSYWTGNSNQWLGGMLALFFGGLGTAAVLAAHLLTTHMEATEPRELPSSLVDHDEAVEAFQSGAGEIRRRTMLAWMAAGGAGLVGVMIVSMFRSLGASPDPALYSTVWKRGQRLMNLDGKPVSADALILGSTTIVFPEDSIGSEKAQTVLLRVDPAQLRLPQERAAWAPKGNLAYSRVCTHAGCPVGMYERTTHQLMCPCHQSTFDVLRGASPSGGPAARPLPQLPLYVDSQGFLCAADGFSDPPGPGFTGMPA
jgi:ubiquinol-cytochrome c reductase iron-sulfur subunit